MQKIQDLFDPSKKIDRKIESVVTFGETNADLLTNEIREYVVTDKIHDNYEKVLEDLQQAFDSSTNEVGIWVSGFYGSGKSSFAKYLGLSFDKSLMLEGQTFGERLMSRIQDTAIAAMHKAIIARHNPIVVMIDLTNKSRGGGDMTVPDIIYYETLKQLGITKSTDEKVMAFIDILKTEGLYDQFCQRVKEKYNRSWEMMEGNDALANRALNENIPTLLPQFFPDAQSVRDVAVNSAMSIDEKMQRLIQQIKLSKGNDKVIFVLDEIGNYIADNKALIGDVQGMMQTFKDRFKGKVWVIATAQQTLTEDNPNAQYNSSSIYTLQARFPISVDIEANDIKEIITKRLLGKSPEGKEYLKRLFTQNEQEFKNGIRLELQSRTIYNQVVTEDTFADLYPFLPVHVDILLSLLQKLASQTGGVGLRSVIKLIRDILVENHLADATIGTMATPEHFYDVLQSDMDQNATKEIVEAANKAIAVFQGDDLAVRICKTIATMQILDDFNLSFTNLCALLRIDVQKPVKKDVVRDKLNEILEAEGLTLQEVDGKFQFMTNAILSIREERSRITPRAQDKADVMKEILKDMMMPAPSIAPYQGKTVNVGVDLMENNHSYMVLQSSTLTMEVQFVLATEYEQVKHSILSESTSSENVKRLYWLCTLPREKDALVLDIIRSQKIRAMHANDTDKEIQLYIRSQQDNIDNKSRELKQLLIQAQANSEIIFRGTPRQVTAENFKTEALKPIAQQVFEKYPYASASLSTDCVNKLANYTNLSTLPPALNPLGIIASGTIDTSHKALVEIKDYISMRNEAQGSDLIKYFEQDPYGWLKDTTRYLVALMLKAGMIKIRSAGQDITVFGPKAVDAMSTTTSFNRITIELNTEGELTMPERLKAATMLTSLFGCSQTSPVNDAIATAANRIIEPFLQDCIRLKNRFMEIGLAGSDIIARAVNFATKIKESDGGLAALLLGKDKDCPKVFQYVKDVEKKDNQAHFLDVLARIKDLIDKSGSVTNFALTEDFHNHITDVKEAFNTYLHDSDLYKDTSSVLDLQNNLNTYIRDACVNVESESTTQIAARVAQIRAMQEYGQLTSEQREVIDTQLDNISVECSAKTLPALQRATSEYMSLFIPSGTLPSIEARIRKMAKENATPPVPPIPTPPTTPATTPTGGDTTPPGKTPAPSTSTPQKHTVPMKRQISSRAELQSLIAQLQSLLGTAADNDSFEISLTD